MTPVDSPQPRLTGTDAGWGRLTELDRNGLEVLDREQCLRLLGRATLGRIAITDGALPVILPVNFRLVGGAVVFRTGVGTKLEAATTNAVVAFEVDEIDPIYHSGWSVVVTGVARQATSPRRIAELTMARIPRWAPSIPDRFVEVPVDVVTGRRIVPGRFNLGGDPVPPRPPAR